MVEKVEEYKDMMAEKVTCVADEHPVALYGLGWLVGLVATVPLVIAGYKYFGKCTGKAAAKELLDAGVFLGYTHK